MMEHRNQRAVLLTVSHCTHPDLDAADKMLLVYLAMNGDYGTGANCRPGNLNLADAIKLKDRATDNRLKKNIERGLIERTHRANGCKNASVYRIRWDSPFFPDHTPGGESLKPRTLECADNPVGPSRTAHHDGVNRAPDPVEPRIPGTQTAQSRVPTTNASPIQHQPPTQTAQPKGGEVGALMERLPVEMHGAIFRRGEKEAVVAQIEEYGVEVVAKAIARWVDLRDMSVDTLKIKWTKWLEEGAPHLVAVRKEIAEAVQRAKDEPFLQASIERQTQELVKKRDEGPRWEDLDGGERFEDFLAEQG